MGTKSKLLSVALLMLFVLLGCTPGNMVRLTYQASDTKVLPSPDAPRIAFVLFSDQRPEISVGAKKDGTKFEAITPVTDWVTRAIADELSRMGAQVSLAQTLEQAKAAKPNYIVTGTISEVWVKEISTTNYSATIRLQFNLANQNTTIYSENLMSNQESSGLPKQDLVDNLLASVMRDIAGVSAAKIKERTR